MNFEKRIKKRIRTKFIFYFASVLISCTSVTYAQISEGGIPPSFSQRQMLRSEVQPVEVAVDLYIKDLRTVDEWQALIGIPTPVARLIPVDYTIENAGEWTTLPTGELIWRLRLKAPDAVALMLYYQDFYIPEGGRLFIYSADHSQVIGAYTHRTHPAAGLFATEFISGDELVLEYVASQDSGEKPRLHINEIGYGYNTAALRAFCNVRQVTTRAESGDCEVNINCEEGDAWQNEKKGVCHTVQKIGNVSYICTATLLNNTAEDFTPYILTARHCAYDGTKVASADDMKQWAFYFHMERESCDNSSLPVVRRTMTGCKLVVQTGMAGGSDGMLVQLNEMIPEEYDVFYNGWDRRNTAANSGVNIHYPRGDYMKISTFKNRVTSATFSSSEFTGSSDGCWNVIFAATANGHGVTESGSSGSALFNENKLVVGTLTGGNSSCSYKTGINLFGKMSSHWDRYSADSMHMDAWLDPLKKGVESLEGRFRKLFRPAPVNVTVTNLGASVYLSWNMPYSSETPNHFNVYRNNVKIKEVNKYSYTDETPIAGSLIYAVSAVYADGEESPFSSGIISIVDYKPPTDLKAVRIYNTNNVQLSWNVPVYTQTIYWGTLDLTYATGFQNNIAFYYGQKWLPEEIEAFHGKTIEAVQFYPRSETTYELYITQGDRFYRQPVETSTLEFDMLCTIELNEPFTIDGSNSLIVSINVVKTGNEYPAGCDEGPADDGKGNVYSTDGIDWKKFYDESTPTRFNYNFIVTAIVSSVNGILPAKGSGERVVTRSLTARDSYEAARDTRLVTLKNDVSLRSSIPIAFPQVTQYRLYRFGSLHRVFGPSVSSFVDVAVANNNYYEMTALYGTNESARSSKADIQVVDVEPLSPEVDIYPSLFTDNVFLKGAEHVKRLEVFSITGKRCLSIQDPDEIINTSSLSPGVYFFRLSGENKQLLGVMRTIKTK